MRHAAAIFSLGWLTGLAYSFFSEGHFKVIFAVVVLLICIICVVLSFKGSSASRVKKGIAAVFFAAFSLAVIYNAVYTSNTAGRLSAYSGETVVIEGMVLSSEPGYSGVTVVNGGANGISGRYELNFREQLDCGSHIVARAELLPYDDIEDMMYNYPKGIYANTDSAQLISCEDPSGKGLVYSRILDYRDRVIEKITANTSEDAGTLLAAMFCGETSMLSSKIRLDMNRCGVGHLLAISGFHVSAVAGAVTLILSKLLVFRKVGIVISEVVTAAFVVFSGMKISSIRAFIMLSILLFASIISMDYDPTAAISLCSVVMTLTNPYIVVSASFLLSVAGAFGAAVVSAVIKREYCAYKKWYSGFIVSVSAGLIVLPISVCYFDELSLISPIANFIFVPMSSTVLILCTVFALLGCGDIFLPMIRLAGNICEKMIDLSSYIASKPVYLTIRFKAIPMILICLGMASFTVFVISNNVRITVCAVLAAYAAAMAVLTAGFVYDYGNVYLNITAKDGEYFCLIYSGSEYVSISSGGYFSRSIDSLIARKGLSTPLAEITADDENTNFYRTPLKLVSAENITVQQGALVGSYVIDFAGTELTVYGDRVIINSNDEKICILKGYDEMAAGESVFYVFKGSTVVKCDGESEIHSGYFNEEILLGRR